MKTTSLTSKPFKKQNDCKFDTFLRPPSSDNAGHIYIIKAEVSVVLVFCPTY